MGCCSSPRTTVAGVAVLHFFGALGCIGLCSYLLSLEGPKLEQVLTQSWTLLTTMHLPVVVDADGNVVSNHTRSSTEAVALGKGNVSNTRPTGRSAYDVQPLLEKSDLKPLQTEPPEVLVSDEFLRSDNGSAEVNVSSVVGRDARILESDDDFSDAIRAIALTTELHPLEATTESPDLESSESKSDIDEYITDNIPMIYGETESSYQNISNENSSLSMENENITEDFDGLRRLDELFFTSASTTEDTNAISLNSVSSILFVDEPDHTITSISTESTDTPTEDLNSSSHVSEATQVAPPHHDETTTSSPSSSERSDVETTSASPSNLPLDFTGEEDPLTSTEFIPVSPHTPTLEGQSTETARLGTGNSLPPTTKSPSTSTSMSSSLSTVTSTASSTQDSETTTSSTSVFSSSPSSAENSTTSALEALPSALPLRSHNAATYGHLLVDENSSSADVDPSGKTSNISSTEEPFTITVPPIITTTGFLSTILTSGSDSEGDPELESLLFELRAGASVLGLLVYFIVCAIAAALLIAAAIWRLGGLMVPWLVMEWISVFAAITAVGVLTWRLLVEGVLLWCWWVVVLCTAGVVVLILCLVLVLEAYQILPYEATCDTTDSYEMQYVTDKRRTSISGAQRSERLREYWCGRESTNLH